MSGTPFVNVDDNEVGPCQQRMRLRACGNSWKLIFTVDPAYRGQSLGRFGEAAFRGFLNHDPNKTMMQQFNPDAFAQLAASGLHREYPNKPSNLMLGPADVSSPSELHPVFYGCFDWHSSVHSHWTLVRLLRKFPQMESAASIRALLDKQFTVEGLAVEAGYFKTPDNRSFERMYGWAWLGVCLRLAEGYLAWF